MLLTYDDTMKRNTLKQIVDEYRKNLDSETRRKLLANQKRTLDRELRRLGKVRSNFRNKNQYKALLKWIQNQKPDVVTRP